MDTEAMLSDKKFMVFPRKFNLCLFFSSFAVILGVVFVFEYFSSNASSSRIFNLSIAANLIRTHGQVAVEGKKGWLFYRPAIVSLFKTWPKQNADNIIALRDSLLRDSIQLLVIPVPNKSDVYPELIGAGDPDVVSKQRNRFLVQLSRANINVVDLIPPLKSSKNREELDLKYDSHWNQSGMLIAAQEIAGRLSTLVVSIPKSLSLKTVDTTGHRYDDLYRLLHNNESNDEEGLYKWKSVAFPSGVPYKSESSAPILIFGDSFVNAGSDVNAQLACHIARFSGIPTRNFFTLTASTQGPPTLLDYCKKTKVKPRVVVWVFVSCQLMNTFSHP